MKKQLGITLIELMIVVVIVAIIASIAYPSFREQMNKTRRADAKASLMDAFSKMERHYTQFARYSGTIANSGIPATSLEDFYTISATVTNPNSQTFTLTATPVVGSPQENDNCGNFIIIQDQTKSMSGGSLTGQACGWE